MCPMDGHMTKEQIMCPMDTWLHWTFSTSYGRIMQVQFKLSVKRVNETKWVLHMFFLQLFSKTAWERLFGAISRLRTLYNLLWTTHRYSGLDLSK